MRARAGRLAVLLALAGWAAASGMPGVDADGVRFAERFLSAPELRDGTGANGGEEIATAFLSARLARAGLEPAGRVGYYLPVATEFESASARSSVVTPGGPLAFGADFRPFPESAAGTAEGEVTREEGNGDRSLEGRILLLDAVSFPREAVRDAASRGAAAVLVRADPARLTRDRVHLGDGRELAGFVVDRGTEFGFRAAPGDPEQVLRLGEVREIRFAVPPGPIPAGGVFGRSLDDHRAPVPVVGLSAEAPVRAGDRIRLHVCFRAERVLRRHVAARVGGRGAGEVRLSARLGHPAEVAAALGAAEALAREPDAGRPVLVVFLSAADGREITAGEIRPEGKDAVAAAEAAVAAVRELRRSDPGRGTGAPLPPPATEDPPAPTLEAAREERAAGRPERAERAIAGALAKRPGDAALLLERGRIRVAAGDFEGVEATCADLAALSPGLSWLLRAEAELARGREEEGTLALERAAGEKVGAALLRRARRIFDEMGAVDEARADLQTALGEDREGPGGIAARGALLLLMGRAGEAEDLLSRAVSGDGGLAVALLWRADARIELGRCGEATEDLDRAWALGLREPAVLFQRGLCSLRLRRFTLAIRDFEAYSAVRPGSAAALYNVACAHALAGNREDALNWLGRAVEAGFRDEAHARTDPDLEDLRPDPRFGAIFESAERE